MTCGAKWQRAIICLLIIMLLPAAGLAGFNAKSAHAAYPGLKGMLELKEESIHGEHVRFTWNLNNSYYQLSISVYDEDYFSLNPSSYQLDEYPVIVGGTVESYEYEFVAEGLEPGNYWINLKLTLRAGSGPFYNDWHTFTVPRKGEFSVYLFGPRHQVENLRFVAGAETVTPTAEEGSGYWKYSAEIYSNACVTLTDDEGYAYSNYAPLCAADNWEHVVHANKTGYIVDLFDYDVTVRDGTISGYVRFANSGESGTFHLRVVNSAADIVRYCDEVAPDMEMKSAFSCDWHDGDDLLQLDFWDGEFIPTNAVLVLDEAELPSLEAFVDTDAEVGRVEPTIAFAQTADESDIALYKIIPPYDKEDIELPHGVRYIPADGSGAYTATFGASQTFVGDYFTIRMIDKFGREHAPALFVQVIDDMTLPSLQEDNGLLVYYGLGCGGSITLSWQCDYFYPYNGDHKPVNPWFWNGTVGWALPDAGDYTIAAYDIYLAHDGEEGMRFDPVARVNLAPDHPGTFEYSFSDIPENAGFAAAVALLAYRDDDGEEHVFYSKPFLIELTDDLWSLVEDSDLMNFDDGSYGYVAKGLTAAALIDQFMLFPGTEASVVSGNVSLTNNDPVLPGTKLVLKFGARQDTIEFRFLRDLVRPSGTEEVTIGHIAAYVIGQLAMSSPEDVTGDGEFDLEDIRLLLGELDN